jgi:UDP-N-acetylmuramyl pentapeptide phosphotransferase/UDP-N-acetylglucosamine-1-phosphate transferase
MPQSELTLPAVGLFVLAALGSYGACWGVLAALRRWSVWDVPNERSSHSQPTPRGGGLGIIAAFVVLAVALAVVRRDAFCGAAGGLVLALAVLSFLDDRFNLSWRVRLGGHLVAAFVGALLVRPELGPMGWVMVPVLVLLLAGHANAFNFMDGINGIAAGQTVVAGAALAILTAGGAGEPSTMSLLALGLAGAAAGFLPHNFPRARMFMGDVGSVPLGFALMFLSAWWAQDQGLLAWVPLLAIHSGFIFDTGVTLVRRWARGDRLHEAHREHFYQRLVRAGWSHPAATGSFLLVSAGVSGAAIVLHSRNASPLWSAAVAIVAWGMFFALAETEFRRAQRQSAARART